MAQEMHTESIIIDCGSEKAKQKNNTHILQQPSTCPWQSKSPVDVFCMKNKAQTERNNNNVTFPSLLSTFIY